MGSSPVSIIFTTSLLWIRRVFSHHHVILLQRGNLGPEEFHFLSKVTQHIKNEHWGSSDSWEHFKGLFKVKFNTLFRCFINSRNLPHQKSFFILSLLAPASIVITVCRMKSSECVDDVSEFRHAEFGLGIWHVPHQCKPYRVIWVCLQTS